MCRSATRGAGYLNAAGAKRACVSKNDSLTSDSVEPSAPIASAQLGSERWRCVLVAELLMAEGIGAVGDRVVVHRVGGRAGDDRSRGHGRDEAHDLAAFGFAAKCEATDCGSGDDGGQD